MFKLGILADLENDENYEKLERDAVRRHFINIKCFTTIDSTRTTVFNERLMPYALQLVRRWKPKANELTKALSSGLFLTKEPIH